MRSDKRAMVSISGLNRMTKKEVRGLVSWLHCKARALDDAVEVGKPWLVTRKSFASTLRYSLLK